MLRRGWSVGDMICRLTFTSAYADFTDAAKMIFDRGEAEDDGVNV